MFTKDLAELKNKQQTEMNNTLERINSRITEAEEWINDLGDRMVEITAKEQNKKDNEKKKGNSLKHTNTCIIGVPEGEKRERT